MYLDLDDEVALKAVAHFVNATRSKTAAALMALNALRLTFKSADPDRSDADIAEEMLALTAVFVHGVNNPD